MKIFQEILIFIGIISLCFGIYQIYQAAMYVALGIILIYLGYPRMMEGKDDIRQTTGKKS